MKGILRLFGTSAALVFVLTSVQPVQAQFGIGVGLNFENFTDLDTQDGRATFENATGYHIGVFYNLAVGPVGIRPGIFYRQIGEVETDLRQTVLQEVRRFNLSLIEIPVDLLLRFAALPVVKPYVMAGPVFMFANTDDDDFSENLKDFTTAANIGIGVEIAPPLLSLRFFPEIRYGFGLTGFMEEELQFGDVTIRAEDEQRFNTLMLRLGITF